MRFRSRFFGILALVALAWVCYGLFASSSAFQTTVERNTENSTAFTAGAGIGAGIGLTFFLCTGIPVLLLFSLLSWRNSAGLKTEQRHAEQIAALKGK